MEHETIVNFETSVVGPLVILIALAKRQIGQGYSKSGWFSGRPSMSPFISIFFKSGNRDMTKTLMNKLREILFW